MNMTVLVFNSPVWVKYKPHEQQITEIEQGPIHSTELLNYCTSNKVSTNSWLPLRRVLQQVTLPKSNELFYNTNLRINNPLTFISCASFKTPFYCFVTERPMFATKALSPNFPSLMLTTLDYRNLPGRAAWTINHYFSHK